MTATRLSSTRIARALYVRGLVQGVGFRPFVHRTAVRCGVDGFVRNESGAVYIEVEGEPAAVDEFTAILEAEAPPLSRLHAVDVVRIAPTGRRGFQIEASVSHDDQRLPVAPDTSMCTQCERELLDPRNRRYGYPFITCTDCGPRYTVIESMPYDRARTTMRVFTQCDTCSGEFESCDDRRYHSQTNSCFDCGPTLQLVDGDGTVLCHGNDTLVRVADMLRSGNIVAARGLGGFHLVVDATNERAVCRLRERKHRDAKPFAVMASSMEHLQNLADVDMAERAQLLSPERPIVLLQRRAETPLASSIAPGLNTVGVMLPYTPLHRLLLDQVGRPLVMTSGNTADEPLCTGNGEAVQRLNGLADVFLLHNREISSRYDDSVVRVVDGEPVFIRRARGYAPMPVPMPCDAPVPLVAVGPHLKNTFTLASGRLAFVSQHIGDLENLETLQHFQDTYASYRQLFRIQPVVAARDLHPGYLSTRIAADLDCERVIPIQHHHAHVAAVAAEHGITDPVIGVTFDGTGYGDDGCIWGGEVLVADLASYKRVGHLAYTTLPGGDRAARQPWRSALGFLAGAKRATSDFSHVFAGVPSEEFTIAQRQIARNINAYRTSSMGRLFDAAAAILGLHQRVNFEGQAAMELESLAGDVRADPIIMPLHRANECWVMDPLPLLMALSKQFTRGTAAPSLAAQFHESVAATTAELVRRVRDQTHIACVVLGGGVFQNARLLSSITARLDGLGFDVRWPRLLSPNDGAISYGQAVVAATILHRAGGH